MKRSISNHNLVSGVARGIGGSFKDISKGIGHLSIEVLSLYGELTDVLDRVPVIGQYSIYDPIGNLIPAEVNNQYKI